MNRVEKVCAIISLMSIVVITTMLSLNTSTTIASKKFFQKEQGNPKILAAKTDNFEENLRNKLKEEKGSWGLSISEISADKKIEINPDKQYHAASLAKLVTAITMLQMVESNEVRLDAEINGATFRGLLELMINRSDNDSWHTLNEFVGFDRMQVAVQKLGMYHTNIYTNRASTADISLLLEELYSRRILNNEHTQYLLSLMRDTETEDRIPASLPKNTVVYHKTGTLDGIIHDAAIIVTHKPYILVMMGEGTNREAGSETIRRISSAVYEEITKTD